MCESDYCDRDPRDYRQQQEQDEYQQWLNDPCEQKEFQKWLDSFEPMASRSDANQKGA